MNKQAQMGQIGPMPQQRIDEHIQRFMPTSFNFRMGDTHIVVSLSSEELMQAKPQVLVEEVVRCELNMSFGQAKMLADTIYQGLTMKGFIAQVTEKKENEE